MTIYYLVQAMNPNSLLDLAFGDDANAVDNSHLPEAQYLPALEKQKELEALLRQQQVGDGCYGACVVVVECNVVSRLSTGTTTALAAAAATAVLRGHAPISSRTRGAQ
jgi:hypothetical protein